MAFKNNYIFNYKRYVAIRFQTINLFLTYNDGKDKKSIEPMIKSLNSLSFSFGFFLVELKPDKILRYFIKVLLFLSFNLVITFVQKASTPT